MSVEILCSDSQLAVCVKPRGVSSEEDMIRLLKEQLGGEVFCVHRLDREAAGVMVFARTEAAAAALSRQVSDRRVSKEYLAVVSGCPEQDEGEMTDLVFHDRAKNKTYVVDRQRRGVREASLSYRVLARDGETSLVLVKLHTGRTHQIRVQFASRKMPLLGDGKYGSTVRCPLALRSYRLAFVHPETGKTVTFSAPPEKIFPWDRFFEFSCGKI